MSRWRSRDDGAHFQIEPKRVFLGDFSGTVPVSKPKQSIDYFDLIEKATEMGISDSIQDLDGFIDKYNIQTDYEKKEMKKVFEWIMGKIELVNENIDWNFEIQRGTASRTYNENVKRTIEDAINWVYKVRGNDEPGPRPTNEGEKLGSRLWESFEKEKDDFLDQFPEEGRTQDYLESKKAAKDFTIHIHKNIVKRFKKSLN